MGLINKADLTIQASGANSGDRRHFAPCPIGQPRVQVHGRSEGETDPRVLLGGGLLKGLGFGI